MTVPAPDPGGSPAASPIAAAIAAAEPVAAEVVAAGAVAGFAAVPPRGETRRARQKGEARALGRELLELPADVAGVVTPLGLNGGSYFYLDALKQLRELAADKHGRSFIMALFGDRGDVLFEHYGKRDKKGELSSGFHADECGNALMNACAEIGIIDPKESVKGVGAWADAAGGLVLHLGDRVWLGGEYVLPGRYGEHIFPAYPPAPRPAITVQSADAGAEVLGLLGTWHWADPLQALLTLGWFGQGFVAGAIGWRSHMIGDGEAGSGKSSLLALVKGLFGTWLLDTSDASPASLHQLMQGRAHPVFIDEFEGGADPKRKAAIVAVLRQASSGGRVTRGGDDHVGRSFSVRFPAFLTAIVPVSLQPQDESRMVRVQLLRLAGKPGGAGQLPDLSPARLAKLGGRLMRRMVDQWPRWAATYAAYRAALDAAAGMDARLQDTYGTLLACADLLLYDGLQDPAEVDAICVRLGDLVAPARAEQLADQLRCLSHLLQCQIDRGGGPRRSIASWLRQAGSHDAFGEPHLDNRREAARALGLVGLRYEESIVARGETPARSLFVVNTHAALARLFADTPWPGTAGAIGAWVTVLRRIEGASVPAAGKSVGGQVQRGSLVPVDTAIDWDVEA